MWKIMTLVFALACLSPLAVVQAKNELPPEVKQCQKGCGDSRTADPVKYETCMNDCKQAQAPATPGNSSRPIRR